MFSPYVDPAELKRFLRLMSKDEMEELLKIVNERLRVEQDGPKLMRLFDNRDILEKAIDNYY